MAITYVNIGARTDTASGNPSIAYPAAIQSGDLLIVCVGIKPNSAGSAPTSTLTWTSVASANVGDLAVYTATYDGSATAPTVATAGARTYAIMVAIRGQAASSLDASATSGASLINKMRYPALTIANDNEIVFTFCEDKENITSVAQTSGFTEIEDYSSGSAAYSFQIQYQIQGTKTNIAQTDPAVTGGSGGNITQLGITIAFVPATSGGFLLTSESNYGGF